VNVVLGDEIKGHGWSACLVVAAAARPADGVARPGPGETARARSSAPCFSLFYLVEIWHRQLLQSLSRPGSRVPMLPRIRCQYGNYTISIEVPARIKQDFD
jgi:hypothetical protein